MVWVELEYKMSWKKEGELKESYEIRYKIEDGIPDEDMCTLVQEARQRLTHKMKAKIDEVCNE